jgi:hypothetical protein
MSTQALREVLERVKENPNGIGDADLGLHAVALAELEAIERMCVLLTTVDTSAPLTPEVVTRATEANETMERIASERRS